MIWWLLARLFGIGEWAITHVARTAIYDEGDYCETKSKVFMREVHTGVIKVKRYEGKIDAQSASLLYGVPTITEYRRSKEAQL